MRHVDRLLSLFCLLMMTFNFVFVCRTHLCFHIKGIDVCGVLPTSCYNIISIILIISSMSRFDFERTLDLCEEMKQRPD